MSTLKGTFGFVEQRKRPSDDNSIFNLRTGTVNSMVDRLSAFASEVTRVVFEVGTQGILGGQARVEGAQGTWADLTRNVNVNLSVFSAIHPPIIVS